MTNNYWEAYFKWSEHLNAASRNNIDAIQEAHTCEAELHRIVRSVVDNDCAFNEATLRAKFEELVIWMQLKCEAAAQYKEATK